VRVCLQAWDRRVLVLAASLRHNVLFVGHPGRASAYVLQPYYKPGRWFAAEGFDYPTKTTWSAMKDRSCKGAKRHPDGYILVTELGPGVVTFKAFTNRDAWFFDSGGQRLDVVICRELSRVGATAKSQRKEGFLKSG